MSYGKMNRIAQILTVTQEKDVDGFISTSEAVLAKVRIYREGRHGSVKWANLAAFSEATDLFRFRTIPKKTVSTDNLLLCDGDRFEILSVENVKGRGMYTEILAKKQVSTLGQH